MKLIWCKLPLIGHKPIDTPSQWSMEHQGYISHCAWCGQEIVSVAWWGA